MKGKSQMNFGPKKGYKTPSPTSTISHAQTNYGGRCTIQGGGNRSSQQKNFMGNYGVKGMSRGGSHFGEKGGTGCNDGY